MLQLLLLLIIIIIVVAATACATAWRGVVWRLQCAWLIKHGADVAINYTGGSLSKQLRQACPKAPTHM